MSLRLLFLLGVSAACGMLGGGGRRQGRNHSSSAAVTPHHFEVTLYNRCRQPVEICYGNDQCLRLTQNETRAVHAGANGELLVRLKSATTGVYADATFATVAVDESCARLDRSSVKP